MTQSLGTIKRGDSFSFTATLSDTATGNPLSGVASRLNCQGRYKSAFNANRDMALLCSLDIEETSTAGTYLFSVSSTSSWKPGSIVEFDIQYTSEDGKISSTETFTLTIQKDITLS